MLKGKLEKLDFAILCELEKLDVAIKTSGYDHVVLQSDGHDW